MRFALPRNSIGMYVHGQLPHPEKLPHRELLPGPGDLPHATGGRNGYLVK